MQMMGLNIRLSKGSMQQKRDMSRNNEKECILYISYIPALEHDFDCELRVWNHEGRIRGNRGILFHVFGAAIPIIHKTVLIALDNFCSTTCY